MELRWTGLGRAGHHAAVPAPRPEVEVDENRATLRRGATLEEWYMAGPLGVEHGFVLGERPEAGSGELVLELTVRGAAPERAGAGGIALRTATGDQAFRYTDLHAIDEDGRVLPATMEADATTLRLVIDDRDARYPLHVDPLLWVEQEKFLPSHPADTYFGSSVSLSGATALVGASAGLANNELGAAYVFVRAGDAWSEEQRLVSSDGVLSDSFGWSTAIDGDTAIVGAPFHDDLGQYSGAAYVFVRSGGVWTEQQQLLASDGAPGQGFGVSVSLSADTALVGAFQDYFDPMAPGSAYVFVRSGGLWTEQQKLMPLDGASEGEFGASVAVDGDTAVVSAAGHLHGGEKTGAAYVFVRVGGIWTEQQELIPAGVTSPDLFGHPVALSGDTAFVAARSEDPVGGVYAFDRSGSVWTETQKLVPADPATSGAFGFSLAVDGDAAIVGAVDAAGPPQDYWGAAYIYARTGSVWGQEQKIVPGDPEESQWFGGAVAIGPDTALVGADSASPAGAAYAFALTLTGAPCSSPSDCTAGWCVDGVCCDSPCGGGDAGDCQACSVAAGAAEDGACGPIADGGGCVDGDACTTADTCQGGACVGGAPVACTALDACHLPGTCDPATGQCDDPAIECMPADDCHEPGTCDVQTGQCMGPASPDGTPCASGYCQSGVCRSGGSTGGGPDSQGPGREDGGCGCQTPGRGGRPSPWYGALAALAVYAARRLKMRT